MAVLVISGAMSLLWVVLIALIVFMEKVMLLASEASSSGAGARVAPPCWLRYTPTTMLSRCGAGIRQIS